MLISLLALRSGFGAAADSERIIDSVKSVERSVGFRPTGNFARSDPRVFAYYRCYFTGKRELPESYDKLRLREGSPAGCPVDATKFDIFFYRIEAVASGHALVTEYLAESAPERIATVVPHEDFHEQVAKLPGPIAEAAATLAGFLTGAAAFHGLSREAELFLQKSELINRYHERLAAIYRTERKEPRVLEEKRNLFASLQAECAAIPPARTFNRCVSAPNNAGLAFDHSYTWYYPLLYSVYERCRKDLKCTVAILERAPKNKPVSELLRYFQQSAPGS